MKKALNIIKKTLVWLVILLAISMMIFTVVSVTTFNRNDRWYNAVRYGDNDGNGTDALLHFSGNNDHQRDDG